MFSNGNTAIDGLSGSGNASLVLCTRIPSTGLTTGVASFRSTNASTGRAILQPECPKLFECKIKLVPDMIAHRARHADATRRALSLKSDRHIDRVAMQVCSIRYGVTNVDPNAKSHRAVRRGLAIKIWGLTLVLHGALHSAVNTLEYHQQRVAPGLDDTAPPCSLIAGSMTSLRSLRSRRSVPLSSSPIRRL
jgi:hypothetical protein